MVQTHQISNQNFTTTEAAEFLGVKPGTLEVWRVQGRGPRFLKLGRAVRYPEAFLLEFMDKNIRASTSDAG